MFLANDLDVIFEVRGGRDGIGKGRKVRNAADGLELVLELEVFLNGDEVDRLLRVIHFDQRVENDLVPEVVEDFHTFFELLEAGAEAIAGRKHHATQDALFGFDGMRRQAVQTRGSRQAGADARPAWTSFRKIPGRATRFSAVD